jgi:hypothetical protein
LCPHQLTEAWVTKAKSNPWAGETLPPRRRVILKVVIAEAAELASS